MKDGDAKQKPAEDKREHYSASFVLAFGVIGFGIGWLVGLSVSPVTNIVVSSLTSLVAAIALVRSGKKQPESSANTGGTEPVNTAHQPNAWPIATLVIGIFIGSTIGLLVRTHNLLSPSGPLPPQTLSLQEEIQQWVDLGMEQDEVVQGYFQNRVNQKPSTTPIPTAVQLQTKPTDSLLYAAASPDECESWQKLIDKEDYAKLKTEIQISGVEPFRELPLIVTDTIELAAIVERVLCVRMD
ncbi:MAG: hypothetical protein R2867_21450 [Caldilineaceae bacterium]